MGNYFERKISGLILPFALVLTSLVGCSTTTMMKKAAVTGQLKKWHRVTLTFNGPVTSEGAVPNPFLCYRLDVTFASGNTSCTAPGFYAADGSAANTSTAEGNKWRVHFTPDKTGTWTYKASFRKGENVAIDDNTYAGQPAAFDGAHGTFKIEATDKTGQDLRGKGKLGYTGQHYLQFAETGQYFIKGGADSPENFLAYFEFDGTFDTEGRKREGENDSNMKFIHRYQPHAGDWRDGDPVWKKGKGKNIIGALNYLAGKKMNSVYFLTYNIDGGDGRDVWPWTWPDEKLRFDCSKLDQWEIVFSHMDRLGIMLHVITQEQENDQGLDGGRLGIQRRLYYRELIARFGHHLAVVWNLGEENTNTNEQRKAFCDYIRRLDPYNHPIVVHTFPKEFNKVYLPLLGYECFEGPSIQIGDKRLTHAETVKWVERSAVSDRKWFVCLDEVGPAGVGVKPDEDNYWHDAVRKDALWGNLMAGGAGCEWYLGYKYPHNDLRCEDWRSRDHMWDLTHYALDFFHEYLPFHQMYPDDSLVSSGWCLVKSGNVYAVYLPNGGSTNLQLAAGKYTVKWYNPRIGGKLQNGSVSQVAGPATVDLGNPPAEADKDWVVLVKSDE